MGANSSSWPGFARGFVAGPGRGVDFGAAILGVGNVDSAAFGAARSAVATAALEGSSAAGCAGVGLGAPACTSALDDSAGMLLGDSVVAKLPVLAESVEAAGSAELAARARTQRAIATIRSTMAPPVHIAAKICC